MTRRIVGAFVATTLLAATGALVACAGTGDTRPTLEERLAKRGYRQTEEVERIPDYRVQGWNYLDDEHILLNTGPSQHYLLTLMFGCTGLSAVEDIGFSTTVSALTRYDKVVLPEDQLPNECPIKQIHRLERIQAEAAAG